MKFRHLFKQEKEIEIFAKP